MGKGEAEPPPDRSAVSATNQARIISSSWSPGTVCGNNTHHTRTTGLVLPFYLHSFNGKQTKNLRLPANYRGAKSALHGRLRLDGVKRNTFSWWAGLLRLPPRVVKQ
mmetsp:Transcript_27739/g.59295  ORF Transcript_27739/g.59295 Transcript_27739/m.59295 type:complete len:107 (+) Transcript_27739:1341-1661(+)